MPADLKPSLYELTLKPYIGTNVTYGDKAFTFEGQMTMHFECLEPTNKIVFHASEMNIDEGALKVTQGASVLNILTTEYDEEREFYTVNLKENCIAKSSYSLYIKYSAAINSCLEGFYISSYLDQTRKRF